MGCVYLARCTANGKSYVGKTIHSLSDRRRGHLIEASTGSGLLFHRAIRKYGVDAFDWSELTKDDEEWLFFMEQKWIKRLGTKVPGGYNLTDGGEGGLRPSERTIKLRTFSLKDISLEQLHGPEKAAEIRRKQSEAKIGGTQTPESNSQRSAALKGRSKSPEAIENMKLAYANKTEDAKRNSFANLKICNDRRAAEGISDHTRRMLKLSHLGNRMSEETKARMKESQKRRRERERTACLAP